MRDSNRDLLVAAARLLRPLLDELVFVGGCATGLLITDEAVPGVRPTLDVDAIAAISSYHEYTAFAERLRDLGFSEDTRDGAPLCRWTHSAVILDVMPLDPKILGFRIAGTGRPSNPPSPVYWSQDCASAASPRRFFWLPNWKLLRDAAAAIISPATIWKICSP
jgi:hypothetical protein